MGEEEREEAIERGEAEPWLDMIVKASRVFDPYQEKCERIEKIYASLEQLSRSTTGDRQFSMFWANVQVMMPSIYSRPPVPAIGPRFETRNKVHSVASEILERAAIVTFEMDDIDGAMRLARDNLILAGRGILWLRLEDSPRKVRTEWLHRSDFLHDPARCWSEVQWVARRAWMSEGSFNKRFGSDDEPAPAMKINREAADIGGSDRSEKIEVWEIWHKEENKVVWVTEGVEKVLDEDKPLLDLEGFFPCPKPAYSTVQPGSLVPVPDYMQVADQLEEINELTARIGALSMSLEVKGLYPAGNEIGDAIEAAEGQLNKGKTLIPVSSFAAMGGNKLADLIVWLPIDMVAATLKTCVEMRKVMIEDVYQITGISDIMRGNTQASETLGAQQLKSQYGSIRIRDKQSELVRLARDATRIMTEIIAENFSKSEILDMTQFEIRTDAEVSKEAKELEAQGKKIEAEIRKASQSEQGRMLAQQNPEQAQAMVQQAQQQLDAISQKIVEVRETPTIEKVMKLFREQRIRPFALDIETDSTIQPDEDAEKQRRAEFLQVMGQTIGQLFPLVQQVPSAASFAGEILKFSLAPYRVGRSLNDSVDEFVKSMEGNASQPQENPEAQAAQAQAQSEQAKAQNEQAKLQMEAQKFQTQAQLDQARLQMDADKAQAEQARQMIEAADKEAQRRADMEKSRLEDERERFKAQLSSLTAIQTAQISADSKANVERMKAELEAALHFSDHDHDAAMQERTAEQSAESAAQRETVSEA